MDIVDIDETLQLRTIHNDDICNAWLDALNNKNHMKWSRQRHFNHSNASIRNYIDALNRSGGTMLGIFLKTNNSILVGTITIRRTVNYTMFGFLVFPEFAGRGLLKKCVPILFDTTMQDYRIRGFYIGTHKKNIPMKRIAEQNGFISCDFEKLPKELSALTKNNGLILHYLRDL